MEYEVSLIDVEADKEVRLGRFLQILKDGEDADEDTIVYYVTKAGLIEYRTICDVIVRPVANSNPFEIEKRIGDVIIRYSAPSEVELRRLVQAGWAQPNVETK